MTQEKQNSRKHVTHTKPLDGWGDWPYSSRPERKTAPLSMSLTTVARRRSHRNRNGPGQDEERERRREERGWQGEQEHFQRSRQVVLRREEAHLKQQIWRLDAEEAAISAQWAALALPPSLLIHLFIAFVVLGSLVVLVLFYPILLVPLIVVLLTLAKARRRHRFISRSRQHNISARQERDRLERRWSGIVAERSVIKQQLASVQSELDQLHLP